MRLGQVRKQAVMTFVTCPSVSGRLRQNSFRERFVFVELAGALQSSRSRPRGGNGASLGQASKGNKRRQQQMTIKRGAAGRAKTVPSDAGPSYATSLSASTRAAVFENNETTLLRAKVEKVPQEERLANSLFDKPVDAATSSKVKLAGTWLTHRTRGLTVYTLARRIPEFVQITSAYARIQSTLKPSQLLRRSFREQGKLCSPLWRPSY